MKYALLLTALIILSGCNSPPPAQVLTTPDTSLGIVSQGTVTNFPFVGTSLTMFDDTNRGITCYVMSQNGASGDPRLDIACAPTMKRVERDHTVQLIVPVTTKTPPN